MRVFVSWSGDLSRTAADTLSQWINTAFPVKYVHTFFSPKALKPGDRWRDILKRQLSSSDVAILVLTRESKAAEWVLFEAGAVGKAIASRLYPVLVDLGPRDLPQPFEQFQAADMRDKNQMWELVWRIREQVRRAHGHRISKAPLEAKFSAWWPGFRRTLAHLTDHTFSASGDWSLVEQCLVAEQIADSPFQAKDVFRVARHRLDLIAQNHHYITVDRHDEHLTILRDFLRRPGREVNILLMRSDPDDPAVKAWTDLMGTPHFPVDLQNATGAIRNWLSISKSEHWAGRLTAKVTGLIPTSQTFFDPEHPHGGLVIVPMVNKPSNLDRPVFLVTKKQQRVAFDSYWTAFNERWRRAMSL